MSMKKSPRVFLRSRILVNHVGRLLTVIAALVTYFTIRGQRAQRVAG